MNILICCEFFFPSVGGVQEVTKQLALRFVKMGHTVTVATSSISDRVIDEYKNIKIQSFNVRGNYVRGLDGEIDSYKTFIMNGDFDILFIYAAQQWTFDALIHDFSQIKAKKILVPCGFSALYNPEYSEYFSLLPDILRSFDALIFHSTTYRDYQFIKNLGIENLYFVPNGADNAEFDKPVEGFRRTYGISEDDNLLLTVGALNGAKGHLEVVRAFSILKHKGPLSLVLNGNKMPRYSLSRTELRKFFYVNRSNLIPRFLNIFGKIIFYCGYQRKLHSIISKVNAGKFGVNKKVHLLDLDRDSLIKCFFESNLFIFASKIEYSPLVLFESAAAGLPFLTVDVGNAKEIVLWTKGGVICPSETDQKGYTRVDTNILAGLIDEFLSNPAEIKSLRINGRKSWKDRFNWDTISKEYEKIFIGTLGTTESKKVINKNE